MYSSLCSLWKVISGSGFGCPSAGVFGFYCFAYLQPSVFSFSKRSLTVFLALRNRLRRAVPCVGGTAVPRMFVRTAPCVSKDILVGTWETDTTPLVRPNEKCCCSLVTGAPRDPSLRDAQRREEHRRDGRQQRVQSLREGVRCVADTRRVTCTPQRPQPPKTVRVTATAQSDSDKTATHIQTPAPAHTHIVTRSFIHSEVTLSTRGTRTHKCHLYHHTHGCTAVSFQTWLWTRCSSSSCVSSFRVGTLLPVSRLTVCSHTSFACCGPGRPVRTLFGLEG